MSWRRRIVIFLLCSCCSSALVRGQREQGGRSVQRVLRRRRQKQEPDSRCFLDGGGSTETFFVRESLPIGSLVGTLRVIGEPGKDIDIEIRPRNGRKGGDRIPLELAEGSKNLVLTASLDKEGFDGPDAIALDLLCEKKDSSDPSFSIPLDIRVTDVNDNAPVFGKRVYRANISELSSVGSAVFSADAAVSALDADRPGPYSTVVYSLEGKDAEK